MDYNYLTLVFPGITILLIALFFVYYIKICLPARGTLEWIFYKDRKPFKLSNLRHKTDGMDKLILLAITALYGAVAFLGLGVNTAPQSFYRFNSTKDAVSITLDSPAEIGSIMYYSGLWAGHYDIALSLDGETWTEQPMVNEEDDIYAMDQKWSELFKWQYVTLGENLPETAFIKITASRAPIELGEVAIYDTEGKMIIGLSTDAPALFDEQAVVPDAPSYLNSAYFDEIYHARTAYEHATNEYPYEVSHPPLGKLIISIGVHLFGMTPFGWRFMGTLFGVLMLPVFYVFLKNLFGKRVISICGTLLFAFDFMHFTQTRIATIDTYSVFFILLMYYFMYRYITRDYDSPFYKTVPDLFLCGLMFGIGAAAKWTSIYAGAGLAALYVIHLVMRGRYYYKNDNTRSFVGYLIKTLVVSVAFFIVIPAAVYYLSYIPYGLAKGMSVGKGMLWSKDFFNIFWDNQKFMFSYHSQLTATHSYSSVWYEWIFNIRPILYYLNTDPATGLKSAFAAFGNPVVWWGGLLAMAAMFWRAVWHRDGKALFILIGYFSQLAPWFLITRCTFSYHYFPSTIFLVLAISHVFNTIWDRKIGRYKLAVFSFTGGALLLFAAFYPVLTGVPVPRWYTTGFLRWIPPKWPF